MNQQESAAFGTSVRTLDRALREVERLKRQRLVLARHVGVQRGQLDLARRIIDRMECTRASGISDRCDHAIAVLRQAEEIEHLRDEATSLSQQFIQYRASTAADTESVLDASWESAKQLRHAHYEIDRLRAQRRRLARHLHQYRGTLRLWVEIERSTSSFWWPFNHALTGCAPLVRGIKRAFKRVAGRLILTPLLGWRGAREMEAILDA